MVALKELLEMFNISRFTPRNSEVHQIVLLS